MRKQFGVYFTPPAVVGAQVRLVEDVLRGRLGCGEGFADERVLIVDPTCGGGAYPLAILGLVGLQRGDVVRRMRLWETLPEAVALSRARGLPAVQGDALEVIPALEAPIVVCIGNPPYRRRARTADLDGFARGTAGVHLKNLYNDYVYFWRWALGAALERRTGPAVVCLVTGASYLRGPAFAGMRRCLRQAFDDLWLIDLEGDSRAARASSNVFPIRTPVAIALGVRYSGTVATPANVHYTRINGSAAAKLSTLGAVRRLHDLEWRTARAESAAPLVPVHDNAYFGWPALTDLFPWHTSGVQLKRTWPIGHTPEVLDARWRRLAQASDRDALFGVTRDRDTTSTPASVLDDVRLPALNNLAPDAPCPEPVRYAYRPFDRRWLLADARLGDFLRPQLWRAHGQQQVYLTTMLTNVLGPGPAAIATALVPDLDHFRGSFGARGVIPLWRDSAATQPNVSAAWLCRLQETYGYAVSARDLMGYCYAVLAGRGYVRRFEEELRTPGPRIPLTLDGAVFRRGASLGESLLAVHAYREVAVAQCRVMCAFGDQYPTQFIYESEVLKIGDGAVGPVAHEVWDYSVSGYRVLPSWVRRRIVPRGRSELDRIQPTHWTDTLTRELLELVWLIEKTLAVQADLQTLLDAVLSGGCVQVVPAPEQVADGARLQWSREEEALAGVASELLETVPL